MSNVKSTILILLVFMMTFTISSSTSSWAQVKEKTIDDQKTFPPALQKPASTFDRGIAFMDASEMQVDGVENYGMIGYRGFPYCKHGFWGEVRWIIPFLAVPPQPWSTLRNLPLLLLGLGVAYLMLRDARASEDRAFWWIGTMILTSYACYLPVILLVQRIPLIGMLMIPKTMAYVAVGLLAYWELWRAPLTQGTLGRQAH